MDPRALDGTGSGSGGDTDGGGPPPPDGESLTVRQVRGYDALGRLIRSEQRNNEVPDPDTINSYQYDQAVSVSPHVVPTNVLGRLALATSPTSAVSFSYDAFGQVNARSFIDPYGLLHVEKHTFHGDGSLASLDLLLPDTGYTDEHVDYTYDSAGRGDSVKYTRGPDHQDLFSASTIDPFGRIRQARYGATSFSASYSDVGRRLLTQVVVSSPLGSRSISPDGYDPVGRERSRVERKDGTATTTSFVYDSLGRISSAVQTRGATTVFNQQFTYDALGNLLVLSDSAGESGATTTTLRYLETDRDRICRIAYAADSDTACNVAYDPLGDIIEQPTRTGTRRLGFFADGKLRKITEGSTSAQFRYDAAGNVQELDLMSDTSLDTRQDRRYGTLLEWRHERSGDATTAVLSRKIPGPEGFVATRRGASGPWVFGFGEARGNRFFTDDTGAFVQDVNYSPYGEARSTGAQPGSNLYSREQWNGGDALAALGVSHLGARLYDPIIGRFLSRDPLLIPRTAAATNPYAFALNDPVNASDPSGADCIGIECSGGPGGPCVYCGVTVGRDGRGHDLGRELGKVGRGVQNLVTSLGELLFGDDDNSGSADSAQARTLTRNAALASQVQANLNEPDITKLLTEIETERISHIDDGIINMGLGPLRLIPGPIGRGFQYADMIYDCATGLCNRIIDPTNDYSAFTDGGWIPPSRGMRMPGVRAAPARRDTVTANGQRAAPDGTPLGPSGKKEYHYSYSATRKQAIDGAKHQGAGSVEFDSANNKQPGHWHAIDRNGERVNGPQKTHWNIRGSKPRKP